MLSLLVVQEFHNATSPPQPYPINWKTNSVHLWPEMFNAAYLPVVTTDSPKHFNNRRSQSGTSMAACLTDDY